MEREKNRLTEVQLKMNATKNRTKIKKIDPKGANKTKKTENRTAQDPKKEEDHERQFFSVKTSVQTPGIGEKTLSGVQS